MVTKRCIDYSRNYYVMCLLVMFVFAQLAFAITDKWTSSKCTLAPCDKSRMICNGSVDIGIDEHNIEFLILYNNSTASLSKDSLTNLPNFKYIRVACHKGSTIPCGTLHLEEDVLEPVQETIQQFLLCGQTVQKLPFNLFCGMSELKEITLANNSAKIEIENIGLGTGGCGVVSSGKKMRHLHFSGNYIKMIPKHAFNLLTNLRGINLQNNKLEKIEVGAFEGLVNVNHIILKNNHLQTLPENLFEHLNELQFIRLENNRLESLPCILNVPKLRSLGLSDNRLNILDNLPTALLNQLTYLSLSRNPLQNSKTQDIISTNAIIAKNYSENKTQDFKICQRANIFNNAIIENALQTNPLIKFHPCKDLFFNSSNGKHSKISNFFIVDESNKMYCEDYRLEAVLQLLTRRESDCLKVNIVGSGLHIFPNLSVFSWIEELNLGKNNIKCIAELPNLVSHTLMRINLQNNHISEIKKQTFSLFVDMEWIILSQNKITSIQHGAFSTNIHLFRVDLDHNRLVTIDMLFDNLRPHFILASNNLIQSFTFKFHPFSRLKVLDLSHNLIENFTFHNSEILVIHPSMLVDLSHNMVNNVSSSNMPMYATHIRLNNNSIKEFETSLLQHLPYIEYINLQNNQIKTLCDFPSMQVREKGSVSIALKGNPLLCSCEVEWIQEGTRKLATVEDSQFLRCEKNFPDGIKIRQMQKWNYFLCKPNKCSCPQCISTAKNLCNKQCQESCHMSFNANISFVIIDCSNQHLTAVPEGIEETGQIYEFLYLDGNDIQYLNESEIYTPVRQLFLNNTNLRHMHPNAFKYPYVLKVLHLENNFLETLPTSQFPKLTSLEELYLSHNLIVQLNHIDQLTELTIFHVDYNNITHYPIWQLENMTKLTTIALDGNPWSCQCDIVENFQNWLMHTTKVMDPNKTICMTDSESRHLISDKFSECTAIIVLISYVPIVAAVLGFSALLITLISLSVFYRNEIQVLLHAYIGIQIGRKTMSGMAQDKPFDLFVSYSDKDEDFLAENILPKLEAIDNPYRVCLLQRNFTAGGYIGDNITFAIEQSHNILILLSKNYTESNWCCFEFKMAYTKMIEDKSPRLIVVILDRVPENTNSTMAAYLSKNTYLRWGDKLFWEKIHFALQVRTT